MDIYVRECYYFELACANREHGDPIKVVRKDKEALIWKRWSIRQ